MGELAEDMIDGSCCSLCGCYFIAENKDDLVYTHGYPVACWDCWEEDCGFPRAEKDTF